MTKWWWRNLLVLQAPDVFTELHCVLIPFVLNEHMWFWYLCLKVVLQCLLCGWGRNFCLINDVQVIAISVYRAGIWIKAVTITIIGGIRFINLGFVVVRNNWFDVTHAAVAQFKCVPVENFVKWVWFRKVLVKEREEALPYVCFYILAKRWIVPKNVSWTVSLWSLCVWLFVWQVVIIATLTECFLVHRFGVVKTMPNP